ncbi:MAG: hypothetical protein JOZ25_06530 [Actinobacteria bacterium]|nr:hypothetical protein [Actinomycetota bacterium]
MTTSRATALGALIVAAVVAAAFAGYEIGHSSRHTAADARSARAAAERSAFASARADAYRHARSSAYGRGFADGTKQGGKDGAGGTQAPPPAKHAARSAAGQCPNGQYTTSSGSCAPDPPGYGGPPANSPEGKKIIQSDPGCQNPPPPPNYSGPVECNNP